MNVEKKLEELERRIRDLEARPVYVPYPIYPAPQPTWPSSPWSDRWVITCDNTGTSQ